MNDIDADQLRVMMSAISEQISAQRDHLNKLDSALGDGDHGTGISTAFADAVEKLAALEAPTPADVLRTTAMSLMNRMGGASGALYGTLFLRASTPVKDKTALTLSDFVILLQAGLDGVKQRGQADVGGKTMIDALSPAVAALAQADKNNTALVDAFATAAQAAEDGAQSTIDMEAKYGRAKFTGERSVGHMDAGAASISILFAALRDYLQAHSNQE